MGKEYATMQDRTTDPLPFPSQACRDVLTAVLRDGAQRMLSHAIEAEVADWINSHAHLTDPQGHRQVVRNGHLPAREIVTGVGPVQVTQPRVHDRRPPEDASKVQFQDPAAVPAQDQER